MNGFGLLTTTPSKAQIAAFTSVTAASLFLTAFWTQSRLGDRLLPHAFCISSSQPLLMLHLVTDGLIAVAYLIIPWSMVRFVRRRQDVPFGWLAWLFGAFIVACGVTHAIEMWTLWYPVYWYAGVAKAFTAAVSLGTAWVLYRLGPRVLALPSAAQLRAANEALQAEVATRKATELELERAKAQLESMLSQSSAQARQVSAVLDGFFEAAPTGLALVDQDGVFLRVNAALPQLTQRDATAYVGVHVRDSPGVPQEVVDAIERVTRDGQASLAVEVMRTEPSGKPIRWHCTLFAIRLDTGPSMCGCIVQDVTRERMLEQQRAEALAAAEEANRAKDEFLARVSHELRTPLQIALSSAEGLRRLPDTSELARRFVDRLWHGISMQARMINDLLDLSRIVSGKLDIVTEPVDPAAPLLRVLDHWTQRANAAGVTLDTDELRAGEAIVESDPTRLEQIYANLLDNAIRFSAKGSTVRVSGQRQEGTWTLSVRDAGVGMTAAELDFVFRPFAQGRAQPGRGRGLGLGLAIVRSLVDAFGGRVHATSEGPGRGTEVVVVLPLGQSPSVAPPLAASPIPTLQGLRLLVVEDQPDVAWAMHDGLVAMGAHVTVATSFGQALSSLSALDLSAMVTDLDLGPGPGGRELAVAARAMARHMELRIIVVSAFVEDEPVGTRLEGLFDARLVKPVSIEVVARALREDGPD